MAVNKTDLIRVELDNAALADTSGLPVRVVATVGGAGGGDASAANQATEIASLASIDGKIPAQVGGRIPVVLPAGGSGLTDAELRAAAVPVSLAAAPSTPVTNANLDAALSTLATQATLALVKTAVEKIDDFISGARGLVTEDSAAAIKAAVETIDNFISGARGLVTEDNSAGILTALNSIGTLLAAQSDTTETQPVVEVRPTVAAVTTLDYSAINDTSRNIILLAANASRKGAHLVNLGSVDVPLREGVAATPWAYTRKLKAGSELDLEFPASTLALYGYFGQLPDAPILITERS